MKNTSPVSSIALLLSLDGLFLSSISLAFENLLPTIDHYLACERDLDDIDPFDPAYRSWLDDVEAAQMGLYESLALIIGLASECAEDVPLQRMSFLIATLIREESPKAFDQYFELENSFIGCMAVPGDSWNATQARHMLAAARAKIHTMAGLSISDQEIDSIFYGEREQHSAAA